MGLLKLSKFCYEFVCPLLLQQCLLWKRTCKGQAPAIELAGVNLRLF